MYYSGILKLFQDIFLKKPSFLLNIQRRESINFSVWIEAKVIDTVVWCCTFHCNNKYKN